MLEFSLATEFQNLNPKHKSRFRYLSDSGFSFLESIPEIVEHIENGGNQNNNDDVQTWVEALQLPETWESFHQKNPVWSSHIKELQQFFDKQKNFILCSNECLLKTLEDILLLLAHIKKANRELAKHHKRLPHHFAFRYAKYLSELNASLLETQQQIIYAMYGRLKVSYVHNNLVLDKKPNMDDVLFHVTDRLNVLGLTDRPEMNSIQPRTTLNEHFQIKFYDAVKIHAKSEEEKHYIDMLHWSNNLGSKAFLLSPPKSSAIKNKKAKRNQKNVEYGLRLIKSGKNNESQMAAPRFLQKYLPSERKYPAWFYWQDHKILNFWEKQQSFLYQIHHLYQENIDHQNPASIQQLLDYQKLISDEHQKLLNEEFSFFDFTYKPMIEAWLSCLNRLYQESLMQQKTLEAHIKKQEAINPDMRSEQTHLQQWHKKNSSTSENKQNCHTKYRSDFYPPYTSKEKYRKSPTHTLVETQTSQESLMHSFQ